MKKTQMAFNLSLALFPILDVYASFIPGISIGQMILLVSSIAVTISTIKCKESYVNIPSLLFVGYIFVTSVFSMLSDYSVFTHTAYTLISQMLFWAFLFVSHNSFIKDYFSKVYVPVAGVVAALSIVQYLIFTVCGKAILFIVPGMPLEIGVTYDYLVKAFVRAQGCFIEPAHLAQFLAIAIILILSVEQKTARDYIVLGVVTVACAMTMSGNAILMLGVIFLVFVYYYIKEKKDLKKLAIFTGAGVGMVLILLLTSDTVRGLFARVSELIGTGETVSSGYYRTKRGYELFAQFPFLSQFFGIGCGNIGDFCTYYGIQGQFFVDPNHGMYTYLNGIQFYLTGTGVIGFLLYALVLLQGKGKTKVHTYSLCVLLGLSFVAAVYASPIWLILLSLVIDDKMVSRKYTTSVHGMLENVRGIMGIMTGKKCVKKEVKNQLEGTGNSSKESIIMNNTLLSIVIPTYNRYQYLRDCVKSVLTVSSANLEVVIQDNTADNSEFLSFVEGLKDSRVKYYHMAEHVTVSENCSNAVQNATGKYICLLGDDDSICASLIELAEQMDMHGIDAATYGISMYHWPDLLDRCPDLDALISPKFEGEIEKLDPHKLLMKELRNGMQEVYALPRAYHAIVSKDIMEKVRQQTGTYFPGPSPDMANAVGCALYAKNQIKIDVPMIISGYSNASAGGQGRQGQHKGSLKDKNWLPADVEETWTPKVPKLWLGSTIWPESAIKALEACDCGHYEEKMNYGAIYAETLYQDLSSWREVLSCHITVLDFCNMMVRIVSRVAKKLYKIVTREQKQEICVKERMSLLDAVNFQNELNANISIESLFEKAGNG